MVTLVECFREIQIDNIDLFRVDHGVQDGAVVRNELRHGGSVGCEAVLGFVDEAVLCKVFHNSLSEYALEGFCQVAC